MGPYFGGALLLLSLFLAYTYIRRTRCYTKYTKQVTTDDNRSSISNNDDEPNSVHELDQFSVYEECVDCGILGGILRAERHFACDIFRAEINGDFHSGMYIVMYIVCLQWKNIQNGGSKQKIFNEKASDTSVA